MVLSVQANAPIFVAKGLNIKAYITPVKKSAFKYYS